MFGAPSSSPFGAPAAAPFGQTPATPFGTPAAPSFGQTGFGQTPAPSTFGLAAPSFGAAPATGFAGFGQAAAPAVGGFGSGGFGRPAAAPSSGLFGATPAPTVFGQPPTTGGFGTVTTTPSFGAKPTGGLFASVPAPATTTSIFGTPAPAAGSFFGAAPTPAGGSIFGQPAPAPAFGSPVPAPTFGSPAPAPTFGSPAPAPAFGSPAPAFGSPAPLFGAVPATSPFGATAPLGGQPKPGTLAYPFQPSSKNDGTNTINLHSITAMAQYEQKSAEELRLEDYLAGNKGSQAQVPTTSTGFGGFGAVASPAPTTGLFSAPAAPATGGLFGSSAPVSGGLFGSAPAPAPTAGGFGGFGTSITPAFGAPQPAPATGLFGAPAAAPKPGGLFGSTPAPAPAFGGFGATAPTSIFAAPQPAPATGLFGGPALAPKPGSLFGAPAPAPSLFGAPAPANTGLFGTTSAASTSIFGTPATAPATGGLFGSTTPAPATGGFFGTPASTLPAAGGGLFGSTTTPAQPTSLFGAQTPAPTSLFGGAPAAPTSGSLFGSPPSVMPQITPSIPTPSAELLLAQQLAAVENQKKQLELMEAWRGNPISKPKVVASSLYDHSGQSWSSYSDQSSILKSYRAVPRSATKIRPRGFTPTKQYPVTDLGPNNGGSPILSPNRFLGSATKHLFIKSSSMTPKPKTRLLLTNGIDRNTAAKLGNGQYESPDLSRFPTQPSQSPSPMAIKPADSASPLLLQATTSPAHDFYRQVVETPDSTRTSQVLDSPEPCDNHHAPKLTKNGYNVYPTIKALKAMSEADLAAVSEFKVERPGYGSVEWEGTVDVRDVDLDSVVIIENKNVSVYDDAELNGKKPKQGWKLNRPAIITMYGVYPKDGGASSTEAREKFTKKVEKSTKKMGAELISFNAETGVWMFRVAHFSRYSLVDDSDDDSGVDNVTTPSLQTLDDDEGLKLSGASKICAPMDEDESSSSIAFIDDLTLSEGDILGPSEEDDQVVQSAEEAYAMITKEMNDEVAVVSDEQLTSVKEKIFFPHEEEIHLHHDMKSLLIPNSIKPIQICSELAIKCGLKSSSNFDYGLRMRRSFRVGWKPDGSFVHLKKTSHGEQVLLQSKPAITISSRKIEVTKQSLSALPLFQTHQKHSISMRINENDVPFFSLPWGPSGSESSHHASLCTTLKDYEDSSLSCSFEATTKKVVSSSFSLLSCLHGDFGESDDTRRLHAVSTWLKGVVANDVIDSITLAQSRDDIYGSIFAALSGGDFAKASSLAYDSGHLRLSLMLTSSSISVHHFHKSQLEIWNSTGAQCFSPSGLLRILSLSRGDIDSENRIYNADKKKYSIDWRRRFGMYLWACQDFQNLNTLLSILKQYNADVAAGLAPPPTPHYANMTKCENSSTTSKCVLYQILENFLHCGTPIRDIISPSTHTQFSHDYSASFHIAAVLTALTGSKLTFHEEDLIIDAISSQLIMSGFWEWAVYATLCTFGNKEIPPSVAASRRLRAKGIILRFHSSSVDYLSVERRSFLQSLGIPSEWFSEAIAYRSAHEGNFLDYVEHVMHFSFADSLVAIESIAIPYFIFGGKKGHEKLMDIFKALVSMITSSHDADCWNKTVICKPIYNTLVLFKDVENLLASAQDHTDKHQDDIERMIVTAANLEKKFSDYCKTCKECVSMAKIPSGVWLAHPTVFMSEVWKMLSQLHMKLLSFKSGHADFDEIKGFFNDSSKSVSTLAYLLSSSGLFEATEASLDDKSVLRGVCGFKSCSFVK